MRTNIVLNDELVEEAMKYTSTRTRRGLVEEALRTFVEVKSAELRRHTYSDRVRSLQQRLVSVTLRDSSVDLVRKDRHSR
jgi:Arc/MetJ family transcription regulator